MQDIMCIYPFNLHGLTAMAAKISVNGLVTIFTVHGIGYHKKLLIGMWHNLIFKEINTCPGDKPLHYLNK